MDKREAVGFVRKGTYLAVGSISEETFDHRGVLSSGEGSDWGKKFSVFVNVERKMCFIILCFMFFYFILCVFDVGL